MLTIACLLILRLDKIILAITSMYVAIKKANHDDNP